jgi:hypothetical protein
VDPSRSGELSAAAGTLAELTEKFLGGRAEILRLDAGRREVAIG